MIVASLPLAAQKKIGKKSQAKAVPQNIILADDGFSRYRIIVPTAATASELKASSVLQRYLLEISGAALPIIKSDNQKVTTKLCLGKMNGWMN